MAIDPRTLDYAALGILVTVSIVLIYAIIYIHDIPYEMAKKRGHPHRDAIHIAGWVSLFLMHTIWPFLWIWAYLYKPGEGWGTETVQIEASSDLKSDIRKLEALEKKVAELEARLHHSSEDVQRESEAQSSQSNDKGGVA
ncbi:GTPase [hydrothermal vent metagenome]|uniref:GTPase n=1 Tax=hydrothermal vent metagenome TaxID=652676 RepID=A0A1W1BHP4_9ZZZZ